MGVMLKPVERKEAVLLLPSLLVPCLALLLALKNIYGFFSFFPTLTPKPESAIPWCKISKTSSTVPDDFNPSFLPLALHQGQSDVLELAG